MNTPPGTPWLTVQTGSAPLLLCMPHTGTDIPAELEQDFVSPWLARRDTDWWIDRLYAFAGPLGASVVRTGISRSVIDMNRDPSGASLYPGQPTTELCPTTTFDGEPLYRDARVPAPAEIQRRRARYFEPYHRAVAEQIARLRRTHPRVVVYDCHSIRSQIPRLFPGTLPNFNIGTFSGASCDAQLTRAVEKACDAGGWSHITDGRFKGGYTTRHYGRPDEGVHAVQMELACRSYLREPAVPDASNWPVPWSAAEAQPLQAILERVLQACLRFALHGH
ncbi:MAG: N-formylglutamate deformylase [Proteobacteria bacterium]|nr:N-formylglutamate deformylase [Pseudomonadota bacterium]